MVLGAISVYGTNRLHIVEGTPNQIKHVNVLEGRLLRQVSEWFPGKEFIFEQDSIPCHIRKIAMEWFRNNKFKVLKMPEKSPNMNPIENLCKIRNHQIHSESIITKTELIEKLIKV